MQWEEDKIICLDWIKFRITSKNWKSWINRWIITVMTWINRWITFCFFPTLSVKLDSSGVWFPTVWEPRSGLPNPSPRVRKLQTKGPKRGNVDGENDDKPIGKLICSQHFQTNLYHILGYLIVSQYIPNKSHSIPLNPSIFPIRSVVYLGFITPPRVSLRTNSVDPPRLSPLSPRLWLLSPPLVDFQSPFLISTGDSHL